MNKKIKYILFLLIVAVVIISLAFTNAFGFFTYVKLGSKTNKIKTGNIVIEVNDDSSLEISNENSYPLPDENGRNLKPYTFVVNNLGQISNYKLMIVNDEDAIDDDNCEDNLLSLSSLRFQVIRDGSIIKEDLLSNVDSVIDTYTLSNGTQSSYELRIWIDKDAGIEVFNKHFHGKIKLEAE